MIYLLYIYIYKFLFRMFSNFPWMLFCKAQARYDSSMNTNLNLNWEFHYTTHKMAFLLWSQHIYYYSAYLGSGTKMLCTNNYFMISSISINTTRRKSTMEKFGILIYLISFNMFWEIKVFVKQHSMSKSSSKTWRLKSGICHILNELKCIIL